MAKAPDVPDSGGVSEVEKKPPKPSRGEWKKGEQQMVRVKKLETELAKAMNLDEEKGRAVEIGEGVKEIMKIQELLEKLSALHQKAADPARSYWEKERRPAYIGILAAFLQHAAGARELLGGDKPLETALDTLVQLGVKTRKVLDQCADLEKGQAAIAGFIAEAQALVGRKQPERVRQPDGTLQPVTALQPVGVIPPRVNKLDDAEYKKGERARKEKQEILARGDALPRQYVEILEELKGFLVHDVVHHRFWSDPEFSGGKKTVSALAESVIERLEAVVPEPEKPSGTFRIQELDKLKKDLSTLTDRMESQLQRDKTLYSKIVDGVRSKIGKTILGGVVLLGGALVGGPYVANRHWSGQREGSDVPAGAPSHPGSHETPLENGVNVQVEGNSLIFAFPRSEAIALYIGKEGETNVKPVKIPSEAIGQGKWKYDLPDKFKDAQEIGICVHIKAGGEWKQGSKYTGVKLR